MTTETQVQIIVANPLADITQLEAGDIIMSRLLMQKTACLSMWMNAILSIQKTNKPHMSRTLVLEHYQDVKHLEALVCGKLKVFLISRDRRIKYIYIGSDADSDGATAQFAQTDSVMGDPCLRMYRAAVRHGSNFSIMEICPERGIGKEAEGFQKMYDITKRSEQIRK